MFSMLHRTAEQARWGDIVPGTSFELASTTGELSGIECLPVSVATRYPSYVTARRAAELEPNEAAVVLGTAIQYNIAEVVDPLVHVVAKIRKDAIASLKRFDN